MDAPLQCNFDPVPYKVHVDISEPQKPYGSQNDPPELFTPPTDYATLPTPQTELLSLHDQSLSFATDFHAIALDDNYLFGLSEVVTQSTPIPIVFEPEYLKFRFRNLWGQSQYRRELETRLMAQAVIGEVISEVEVWYGDERHHPLEGWASSEVMDSDEETDELADDSDQNTMSVTSSMAQKSRRRARKPRMLHDQANVDHRSGQVESQPPTGYFESPEFQLTDEDDITEDDRLTDPPMDLVIQVAQWTRALRCLLKGKKDFGDKVI